MPRKTLVQCPVVSGYVAARLQDRDWFPAATSGMPTSMLVTFENVGNTNFSVVLNEASDRSTAGTRYPLYGFSGTAAYLVAGGQQTLLLNGHLPYLEVYCTGTTTGQLRMQIESQRQWNQLGFDRLDNSSLTGQSPTLWEAAEIPGPLT